MLANYPRPVATNKSLGEWRNSAARKALVEKIRGFSVGSSVVVSGVIGTVESTDEQTFTVRVTVGKHTHGYSVTAVEPYNK